MTYFSDLIPPENQELYQYLYVVEVGLREFCIDVLSMRYGPRFWRQHLAADLIAKMRAQLQAHRAASWQGVAPQHPLYYLDLPDLIRLVDDDVLWSTVFRYHFRLRGTVTRWLTELAGARITLHANRRPTDAELQAARTSYYELSRGMGDQQLRWRLTHPTTAANRWSLLDALEGELEEQERRWRNGSELLPPDAWKQLEQAWWFDQEYIGSSVDILTAYMDGLAAYVRLVEAGMSGAEAREWAVSTGLTSDAAHIFAELYVIRAALGDE